MSVNENYHRMLVRIRCFEETVLERFSSGVFYGTTHTYLGQEANAVGILSCITDGDIVVSNHRCHGHFLAYGGSPHALFAELMGRETGVCGGRGGSQHLHWRNFYSNGILGGTSPIGTGMALAEKLKKTGKIAIVFLGDGALGEGVVYESLNMASLWHVPVLYVVENNQIAQTTPIELALAGDIKTRFQAFGIHAAELCSSDVIEIAKESSQILTAVRKNESPHALILNTHRFGPHSKGDDTRSEDRIAEIKRNHDPLRIHASRIGASRHQIIQAEVEEEITSAFEQALSDPMPTLNS